MEKYCASLFESLQGLTGKVKQRLTVAVIKKARLPT